jgi:putative phosphoesterase
MKVGLISDTHDNLSMVERALVIFKREGVEAIVHAGDWVAPFTVRKFQDFSGRLYGSYGNNDGEIIGLSRAFREMDAVVRGEFTEFELDGERAVVIHGTYPPVLRAITRSGEFPTIITGHTHIPLIEKQEGVLLVNPGEACGYLYGRCTVGILDTHEREVEIYDLV